MKFFIKTFGCQQNVADSERIISAYNDKGYKKTKTIFQADCIIINTCMIRESAENRIYGLINNLSKREPKPRIIVTGCMTGLAFKDKTGKYLKRLKEILPAVDEFLPIEEIGWQVLPERSNKKIGFVPISNGCNNFCSYCVVPFTRGREVSRPFQEIIKECQQLKQLGYEEILLLGQNVNSYGADLIQKKKSKDSVIPAQAGINNLVDLKPIYVKHLGRYRIPTLFPHLLNTVAKLGFKKVDFMSSNPWDFSDELIETIAKNKNITRTIHLPVQSGSDRILKLMNRWYSRDQYLDLVANLKFNLPAGEAGIKNLKLTTDIIIGFPTETEADFQQTVDLCKKVGFVKAYINRYSPRPFTLSFKKMKDDVPAAEKKRRWQILENLINKA